MERRLELQSLLESLLPAGKRAYFQPPTNVDMQYPCIVYARDRRDISYASNLPYRHKKRYSITVITWDPDSDIPEKVAELPMVSFNRHYTADNLNHDVYTLYF